MCLTQRQRRLRRRPAGSSRTSSLVHRGGNDWFSAGASRSPRGWRRSAIHPTETSHRPLGNDRSVGITCRHLRPKTSARYGSNPGAVSEFRRASCASGVRRSRSRIFPKIARSFRGGSQFFGQLRARPGFPRLAGMRSKHHLINYLVRAKPGAYCD